MLTTAQKITYLTLQMRLSISRAEHFNARALTGVYKKRVVHKGGFDGPLLTEEELLQDEIKTADTHLYMAQECLDEILRLQNRLTDAGEV